MVEIYIKPKGLVPSTDEQDFLPESALELEHLLTQIKFGYDKLQESTDLIIEEFRKSDGDEAREYYEYILENSAILKSKQCRMDSIQRKIDSLKGVHNPPTLDDSSESSGAGGIFGHFI